MQRFLINEKRGEKSQETDNSNETKPQNINITRNQELGGKQKHRTNPKRVTTTHILIDDEKYHINIIT